MRILLVVLHDILPTAFTQVLNPANEYCAIVTEEVAPAKNFIKSTGLPEQLIHSFYELKACIENFYYDVVLCISDGRTATTINEHIKKYGVPQEKFLNIYLTDNSDNIFLLERALRYYKEHVDEFDMFATGSSYMEKGLDSTKFKRKLFNLGKGSQDLYYDYQVAKRVLTPQMGGGQD